MKINFIYSPKWVFFFCCSLVWMGTSIQSVTGLNFLVVALVNISIPLTKSFCLMWGLALFFLFFLLVFLYSSAFFARPFSPVSWPSTRYFEWGHILFPYPSGNRLLPCFKERSGHEVISCPFTSSRFIF